MGTTAQARIIQTLPGRQEKIAKAGLGGTINQLIRSHASPAVQPNREAAILIDNGNIEIKAMALLARNVTQSLNKVVLYKYIVALYTILKLCISGTIMKLRIYMCWY